MFPNLLSSDLILLLLLSDGRSYRRLKNFVMKLFTISTSQNIIMARKLRRRRWAGHRICIT